MSADEAAEAGFDAGAYDGYAGNAYDAYSDTVPAELDITYRAAYCEGFADGQEAYRRTMS